MKNWILIAIIGCLVLLIRLFLFYAESAIYQDGDRFLTTHRITHEPKKNAYGQYFFVENILISLPSFPTYQYGDLLKINGVVTSSQTDKGDFLVVRNPEISIINDSNMPIQVSKFVRERVSESVLHVLPYSDGGLLLGILLGVRDRIDASYYDKLRDAGVLHVIAASGQNVSILASFLLILLERIVKRKLAILFTAVGVMAYAFLTGLDPAIVRASIMAIISFGALVLGRQSSGVYALIATGWIMVFVSPDMAEDISFQLSFMSTLGILTVKPLLDRLLSFATLKILKEDLTTTLSAQIATLPIIMAVFGTYSLLSIPANVAVLWTIPILMIFGGVGAIVSLVQPYLSIPFVLLTYPFLAYFRFVIELVSSVSFSVEFETLPQTIIIGYYLILFGLLVLVNKRRKEKI